MSKTKELDRISSEIAKELEPKVFETISWGLTKTDHYQMERGRLLLTGSEVRFLF